MRRTRNTKPPVGILCHVANTRAQSLIVGDGPDRSMLEHLTEGLGLADAVIFAGYQETPRDFCHLMDVFALASAHEAFGLVSVEAMLSGVSVVGTRVGGIPFVLDDGEAGLLIQPGPLSFLPRRFPKFWATIALADR